MIISIAIISGIMAMFYFFANIAMSKDFHSVNCIMYASINVISSWYLNQALGVILTVIWTLAMFIMVLRLASN